jgi:GntR family transcriptional regulator
VAAVRGSLTSQLELHSAETGDGLLPALDRASITPLWLQLRLILRRQIEHGALPPHSKLPSEAELCEQYDVSRTVVREALGKLVADGRIYKIKGKGAFVSKRKDDEEFVGTTMGLWEEMLGKGHDVRTRVLAQGAGVGTERERAALRLVWDEVVVRLRRVYFVDGAPTILVSTALPAHLVPGLERAPLENRSLYETIRQRYGLVPARAERWLEAALPTREEADILDIPVRTPLIAIESIAMTAAGTPMEYYTALHRTDSTRLHVVSR